MSYLIIHISSSILIYYLGGESGGGTCQNVPIEINNVFTADTNGVWNSAPDFEFGSTLYSMELSGLKFDEGEAAYQTMVSNFAADLKKNSAIATKQDYAANMVFAGTYVTSNFDYGSATFSFDADSRVIYDQTVVAGGFSNGTNSCVPKNTVFSFDSARGHFTVTTTDIVSTYADLWNPCDGMFNVATDLGKISSSPFCCFFVTFSDMFCY